MDSQARPKIAVLAVVLVGVVCASIALWQGSRRPASSKPVVEILEPQQAASAGGARSASAGAHDSPSAPEVSDASVIVHVAGHVKNPGVYTLPATARVIDAVKAAGGSKPTANLDAINLAARLNDAEQVYVPSKQEELATAEGSPGRQSPSASVSFKRTRGGSASAAAPKRVNINTAGPEDLDRLPGVGPAIARRIIDYRKAVGGFAQAEDLINVPGIGEKKFAQMKAWVVVR